MPDQISVSEFVAETLEDYKAPTAENYHTRTAQCRNTVAAVEEVSGSVARTGREDRAAPWAPGRLPRLVPDTQCPPPAPTPGKSFWSPKAGRSRTSSARHRSPLFPALGRGCLATLGLFFGNAPLFPFPTQGFRFFAPILGEVNFSCRVCGGFEPGTPASSAAWE